MFKQVQVDGDSRRRRKKRLSNNFVSTMSLAKLASRQPYRKRQIHGYIRRLLKTCCELFAQPKSLPSRRLIVAIRQPLTEAVELRNQIEWSLIDAPHG